LNFGRQKIDMNVQKQQFKANLSDDSDEIEFRGFVRELIDADYLQDSTLGIAKLVMDEGREKLSVKQNFVFQKNIIDEYAHQKCEMCHQKIPWSEMFSAIDTGLCARCIDQKNKD
jgi:NAD-dependent SIR2 family protein deacetylase